MLIQKKSSYNSNKVYCSGKEHYVDEEDFVEIFKRCKGCVLRRKYYSSYSNLLCPNCHEYTGSNFTGKCTKCGVYIRPRIKEINDDGTIIYDDGSVKTFK